MLSTTTLLALIIATRNSEIKYSEYLETQANNACVKMVKREHNKKLLTKLTDRYIFAGENLGFDYDDENSLIDAFMNSEKHKKIQTSKLYNEIGIGQCKNPAGKTTVFLYGRK